MVFHLQKQQICLPLRYYLSFELMTTSSTFKVHKNGLLPFKINDLKRREEPSKVLMCSPDYFDIVDVKNVHMEGNQSLVNKEMAWHQWNELKAVYDELVDQKIIQELSIIPGVQNCEDMVFCANQSFPWLGSDRTKTVWMSKMRHTSRQNEVPFFENWYLKNGYTTQHFLNVDLFEGMGDTIPHPGKQLLYGGYGHRSDVRAYDELAAALEVQIVALELINENFYHLDTCFVPLSETEVMICKEAFTQEGLEVLRQCFKTIFEIPKSEAIDSFCLNAHVLNLGSNQPRIAILQKGSIVAKSVLLQSNYRIIEIETSEFMKSGGSVFCMKMMYY
jgi:N-dimethylarginine dimethylaminohydrolase